MNKKLGPVFLLFRYCAWLERWHLAIILLSVFAGGVGCVYSAKLYANLKTDMEELLPENAESVKDLRAVTGKVGGFNQLSIVIESKDVEAGRRFQKDVTAALAKLPPTLVARVKDNIIGETAFFDRNKALYVETNDWRDMEHYVRARIRHERRKKNPFSLGLDDDAGAKKADAEPELDFVALKKKYAERAAGASKFKNGYFESRDGQTHIVLAFLPGKSTSMSTNDQLSDAAHELVAKLDPKKYAPDMVVGFAGDVQSIVEEHHGLVQDLVKSFVIVTLVVALVLILFFRSFVGVLALCGSLFAGTAWTFGLSYAIVGYLNANTAFLGSIVVGNGINFGIIMLARYLEERRRGLDAHDALLRSVGFTTQATWTAAIAAGLSYASLMLTDFRGFNQFGIIGGLGMLLCWVSSFTTLPAMLIWVERRGLLRVRLGEARPVIARAFATLVMKFTKPIVALTFLSVLLSIAAMTRLSSDTLESDFSKLRNKYSAEHGAGLWSEKVDAVFERYLTPTVVLTTSDEDSVKVADALKVIQKRDGATSPISEIKTIEDFLPPEQPQKIRIIERIKELLPPKVVAKLNPEDRKLVEELLPKGELSVLSAKDLPDAIVANFRDLDGNIGRLVHVYPKLPPAIKPGQKGAAVGFWDGREVIRFAQRLREGVKVAGVSAWIAGQSPLSADMITAIAKDGPKATAAAFLAVMLLVLVVFPHWALARSILGALILGVVWMAGVVGALDFKINFLNFIALPITFGIGVDYAVNIFSRYRMDGARSIRGVIENTGGAVALCSCTTIIGYSSLLLAGSQAFVSFGRLAVLGELTCITAAVVAFPALWNFFEKRNERREPRVHSRELERR